MDNKEEINKYLKEFDIIIFKIKLLNELLKKLLKAV